MYARKSKSIPQKTIIICIELLLLILSYWLLFRQGGDWVFDKLGIAVKQGDIVPRIFIFSFSVIVFIRMTFMMVYLLKRAIPWSEAFSIPFAFSLYYVGFSLLVYNRTTPANTIDYFAIALFLFGSYLNTASELQRHFWKKEPEHQGKLYTEGLFSYSMHINYFGDVLWVSAYAIVTRNYYAIIIPVFLFCFFAFGNIPMLDKHLAGKYKEQFERYRARTKRFVPFVW